MLRHCARCHMTTAHVDDACQRCKVREALAPKKKMDAETKRKLRDLNDWRRGKRATDPRQEG